MLFLLVKLHYFLPTRWWSLTLLPVMLLHFSVFLFLFNSLISLLMMKAIVSSPPHRPSAGYCKLLREQAPDTPTPLLSFAQSISQCLADFCSAYFPPSYYTCARFPCWQVQITWVYSLWILLCYKQVFPIYISSPLEMTLMHLIQNQFEVKNDLEFF